MGEIVFWFFICVLAVLVFCVLASLVFLAWHYFAVAMEGSRHKFKKKQRRHPVVFHD